MLFRSTEALRFASEPLSLSEPLREDGDAELGDVVEDRSAESPFEMAATAMLPNEIEKLLAPLDSAKLANRAKLLPEFRRRPHDPEDRFTVPYMSGTVGIVINTEKVKTPVRSYRDVFDARFANRIVVLNDSREIEIGRAHV